MQAGESAALPEGIHKSRPYSVVRVVDGDTIKIRRDGEIETVRLIGINTPEVVDPRRPVQCFGRQASEQGHKMMDGARVRIAQDPTQDTRDRYGRLLAYVWIEDEHHTFYNLWMVRNGYAHEYTYDVPYLYQSEFRNAQRYAQTHDNGFWAPSTCNGDTDQPASRSG